MVFLLSFQMWDHFEAKEKGGGKEVDSKVSEPAAPSPSYQDVSYLGEVLTAAEA